MKLFKNACIPTSSSALKRINILFDEQIIKISKDEILCEEPVEVIDLEGALLLPGAVDAHSAIMIDPESHASDLENVSRDAICGGWTTLSEMSFHTGLPCFDGSALKKIKAQIDDSSYCDMGLWGHIDVDEYPYYNESAQDLWQSGLVGILLMNPSPNPKIKALSFTEIMDLFLDIYDSDTLFAFQGFDLEEGDDFNAMTQSSAIKKLLRRMQENPIHLPQVTDFEVIEFINSVSKRSDISFSLSISDFMDVFNNVKRENELPLGFEERLPEFMELLRTNKIYMFSNNVVCKPVVKKPADIFLGASPSRLIYSYVWMLSELWKKKNIPLATCIKMCSENPAKRLGLYPQKGAIDPKSDADFVVFDVDGKTSTGEMDRYGNELILAGAIKSVYLRGELVYDGTGLPLRRGHFVQRKNSPKRRHNKSSWIS